MAKGISIFWIAIALLVMRASNATAMGQEIPPTTTVDVEDLKEEVKSGYVSAILELGATGDQSAVSLLRKVMAEPKKLVNTQEGAAQMALAKLGDQQEFNEIVRDAHSDDPTPMGEGIDKLAYIGGPAAIAALGNLLHDTRGRTRERHKHAFDSVIYGAPYGYAMVALAKIVPNPPLGTKIRHTEENRQIWVKWMEEHKEVWPTLPPSQGTEPTVPHLTTSQMNALKEKSKKGDIRAILALGRSGEVSVRPFLQIVMAAPKKRVGTSAGNAQMALAKLGDNEEFEQIVEDANSIDATTMGFGIEKLIYIGGPPAIKVLADLLAGTRWQRLTESDWLREVRPPAPSKSPSYLAMVALAKIVTNPPLKLQMIQPDEAHRKIWIAWWEQYKAALEAKEKAEPR
jgi:hypothetical protein